MTDSLIKNLRDLAAFAHADLSVADEAADEIERLHERIVELDAFLVIANEQQVAVENENGELRGIIQQAADDVVAASYPRRMHLEWLEAARRVLAKDD